MYIGTHIYHIYEPDTNMSNMTREPMDTIMLQRLCGGIDPTSSVLCGISISQPQLQGQQHNEGTSSVSWPISGMTVPSGSSPGAPGPSHSLAPQGKEYHEASLLSWPMACVPVIVQPPHNTDDIETQSTTMPAASRRPFKLTCQHCRETHHHCSGFIEGERCARCESGGHECIASIQRKRGPKHGSKRRPYKVKRKRAISLESERLPTRTRSGSYTSTQPAHVTGNATSRSPNNRDSLYKIGILNTYCSAKADLDHILKSDTVLNGMASSRPASYCESVYSSAASDLSSSLYNSLDSLLDESNSLSPSSIMSDTDSGIVHDGQDLLSTLLMPPSQGSEPPRRPSSTGLTLENFMKEEDTGLERDPVDSFIDEFRSMAVVKRADSDYELSRASIESLLPAAPYPLGICVASYVTDREK